MTWSGTKRLNPSAAVDFSRSRFAILRPCSFSPHPEIMTVVHGTRPNRNSDWTIE